LTRREGVGFGKKGGRKENDLESGARYGGGGVQESPVERNQRRWVKGFSRGIDAEETFAARAKKQDLRHGLKKGKGEKTNGYKRNLKDQLM